MKLNSLFSKFRSYISCKLEIDKNTELLSKKYSDWIKPNIAMYICEYIEEQVMMIAIDVLVAMVNHDDINNGNMKFIDSVDQKLATDEGFSEIRKSYPEMESLVKSIAEKSQNYIDMIFSDLSNDVDKLEEVFGGLGNLRRIQLSMGDTHKGKSVSILEFEKRVLVYKPREMSVDKEIYDILTSIIQSNKLNSSRTRYIIAPKILIQDSHSWQEFIPSYQNSNNDEMQAFLYNAGVFLAIFYLLGVGDLHFENVICSVGTPVFTDLEAFVSPPREDYEGLDQNKVVGRSVLGSALLPLYNPTLGLNLSGLFTETQSSDNMKYKALQIIDGQLGYVEMQGGISLDKNQEQLKQRFLHKPGMYKYLIQGLVDTLNLMKDDRKLVWSYITNSKLPDLNARVLLRHTTIYSKFIEASRAPEYLMNNSKRKKLFNLMKANFELGKFGYLRVNSEIKSMLEGDIPVFYTPISGQGLLTEDGECIEDYFSCSLLDLIQRRLQELDSSVIEYQLELVKLSLVSGIKIGKLSVQKNGSLLNEHMTNPLDYAKDIFDSVWKRRFKVSDDEFDFYTLVNANEQWLKIDFAKYGIYHTGGLLLTMYAYGICNSEKYKRMAEDLYSQFMRKYRYAVTVKNASAQIDVSVFSGLGGLAYISLVLHGLSQKPEYIKNAKEIIYEIKKILDEKRRKQKINLDFVEGLSGIAVLVCRYISIEPDCVLINWLNEMYEDLDDTLLGDGFAHGRLGVAYAKLVIAATLGRKKCILEICSGIKKNELKDKGWCRGKVGYAQFWLEVGINLHSEGELDSEITEIVTMSLDECLSIDDWAGVSLCHGYFGLIDILIKADKEATWLDSDIRTKIKNRIHGLPRFDVRNIKWQEEVDLVCDSYMLGATGALYEYMRLDKKLPSVLCLEI